MVAEAPQLLGEASVFPHYCWLWRFLLTKGKEPGDSIIDSHGLLLQGLDDHCGCVSDGVPVVDSFLVSRPCFCLGPVGRLGAFSSEPLVQRARGSDGTLTAFDL